MAMKKAPGGHAKPGKPKAGKAKAAKKTPPKSPAKAQDPELAAALEDLENVAPPAPPAAPKRIRSPRLRTADDVRRQVARLYAEARAGAIPTADASKLGSLLSVALRTIDHDLEARLDALEAAMNAGAGTSA